MTTAQTEALTGMSVVLTILALLILPSLLGVARDRRIDREIRAVEETRAAEETRRAREGRDTGETGPRGAGHRTLRRVRTPARS